MNLILSNVVVVDKDSPFFGKNVHIKIENGIYSEISESPISGTSIKDMKGAKISSGWFDPFVDFGDPGFEDREGLDNGLRVASKSGFATVGVVSNTLPRIENKSVQNYVQKYNQLSATKVIAIPSVTLTENGKQQMTEMFDMNQNGAITFFDVEKVPNDELLLRALLYTKNFDAIVTIQSMDGSLNPAGVISEGAASVLTGLKSFPEISEELTISRALRLTKYTEGRLHITGVASSAALELIKQAKLDGIRVTCDVHLANLIWNELELTNFDSNQKVFPPLRSQDDQESLIQGVKDGSIDFVTSFHQPRTEEEKNVEFDHALYGIASLEIMFDTLVRIFGEELAIELVSNRSKSTFNLNKTSISKGNPVSASLYKFCDSELKSTSKGWNNPFQNTKTSVEIVGVISTENAMLS